MSGDVADEALWRLRREVGLLQRQVEYLGAMVLRLSVLVEMPADELGQLRRVWRQCGCRADGRGLNERVGHEADSVDGV